MTRRTTFRRVLDYEQNHCVRTHKNTANRTTNLYLRNSPTISPFIKNRFDNGLRHASWLFCWLYFVSPDAMVCSVI